MKWWKQSKAENRENQISVLDDQLFILDEKNYNFKELLSNHKKLNICDGFEDYGQKLIKLAIHWQWFLNKINSSPINHQESLIKDFQEKVIIRDDLLSVFDDTFNLGTLHYSSKEHFELENFIIPIVLKINNITVDEKLNELVLNYFVKNSVNKTLKEINSYNLEINLEELEHAIPEILKGNASKFGHQYNIISNIRSNTSGGLGSINGFLRKHYQGTNLDKVIMKKAVVLIKYKYRCDSISKENKKLELKVVKNPMIDNINSAIISKLILNNNQLINIFEWLTSVSKKSQIGADENEKIKNHTIVSTLNHLYKNTDFNYRKPSKKLIKVVIDFSLIATSYNTNSFYGISDSGNQYDNFLFHPFLVKLFQWDYVDPKIIKSLTRKGNHGCLLLLSELKCRKKNKHFKQLIRNNIYNLTVKRKYLAEKNYLGWVEKYTQTLFGKTLKIKIFGKIRCLKNKF